MRERILAAAVLSPDLIPDLLPSLPTHEAAQDVVYAAYIKMPQDTRLQIYRKRTVEAWLMTQGKYLRPRLMELAAGGGFLPDTTDVVHVRPDLSALTQLAQLDWNSAEPLLRRDAAGTNPELRVHALSTLFSHAAEAGDQAGMAEYATQFSRISLERFSWAQYDMLDDMRLKTFPGKDETFITYFADPAFSRDETYQMEPQSGGMNYILPRWLLADLPAHLPRVISMLHDANPIVRRNAALSLILADQPETLLPLLPALQEDEAAWPKGFAYALVEHLGKVKVAGSIPGLRTQFTRTTHYAKVRAAAARAMQGDPNAADALRVVAASGYDLSETLRAAMACPSVSIAELQDLFEIGAIADARRRAAGRPLYYGKIAAVPLDRDLAPLVKRARELSTDRPAAFPVFWNLLAEWDSPAIDRELVRRMQVEAPEGDFLDLLRSREQMLVIHEAPALGRLARRTHLPSAGLAAGMLHDTGLQLNVLSKGSLDARRILLNYAARSQVELPIAAVGRQLDLAHGPLRDAAEEYLLEQNSPEADAALRRRHPGEYLIIGGGRTLPSRDAAAPSQDNLAERPGTGEGQLWLLRNEMLQPDHPDEIYALFSNASFSDDGQIILRVRNGQAALQWQMGDGRSLLRDLPPEEWHTLRAWLDTNQADYLPDILDSSVLDGVTYRYAHFTPSGGRDSYLINPDASDFAGSGQDLLSLRFRELVKGGDYSVHYAQEDLMPGTRLLFHRTGTEAIFLAMEEGVMKAWFDSGGRSEWRILLNGQPAGPSETPAAWKLYDPGPRRDEPRPRYTNLVRSPDAKWTVANDNILAQSNSPLVCIDAAGKSAEISFPSGAEGKYVSGYIESRQAFLVRCWQGSRAAHFLFDPEKFTLAPVQGDLDIINNWSGRPLQKSADGRYWMTAYSYKTGNSSIGKFDFDQFKFEKVLTIPYLYLMNGSLWVDESAGRIFFCTTAGDLLETPLPR